jgi:hypothetical protein
MFDYAFSMDVMFISMQFQDVIRQQVGTVDWAVAGA